MEAKMVDSRAVSGILYGVYKALYEVTGTSAPAVMRKAAPYILDQLGRLGVDFSCVDDINKLEDKVKETMISTGMCDDMSFTLENNELTSKISGCSFYDLTRQLESEGIPPFGCPFAAITIALAEKNLGKRARVTQLAPTENGSIGDTTLVVKLHD